MHQKFAEARTEMISIRVTPSMRRTIRKHGLMPRLYELLVMLVALTERMGGRPSDDERSDERGI